MIVEQQTFQDRIASGELPWPPRYICTQCIRTHSLYTDSPAFFMAHAHHALVHDATLIAWIDRARGGAR